MTQKHSDRQTNAERPQDIEALVIGASTGGPKALVSVVKSLPPRVGVPIFIVQHMPAGFTTSFAKRLDSCSPIPVVEAEDGMRIQKGTVYVAPGGRHMVVQSTRIKLLDTEKVHGVKPAVDLLFESAANQYEEKVAAVVLTGMGRDGTAGCLKVQQKGGYVLAQDEQSCVVYGMPKHALESGAVDEMASLDVVAERVKEMVKV